MVACPGECYIQLSVDDVAALSEAVGGEELHLPCVVHCERIDDDFALSGQPFGYVVRTIRKKSDRLQTARKGVQEYTAVFLETADQEKEHAKRFYKFLKDDFVDEAIEIQASFPVSFHQETLKNLLAAAAGENDEWTDLYPTFANVAEEEGYPEVAQAYRDLRVVLSKKKLDGKQYGLFFDYNKLDELDK